MYELHIVCPKRLWKVCIRSNLEGAERTMLGLTQTWQCEVLRCVPKTLAITVLRENNKTTEFITSSRAMNFALCTPIRILYRRLRHTRSNSWTRNAVSVSSWSNKIWTLQNGKNESSKFLESTTFYDWIFEVIVFQGSNNLIVGFWMWTETVTP